MDSEGYTEMIRRLHFWKCLVLNQWVLRFPGTEGSPSSQAACSKQKSTLQSPTRIISGSSSTTSSSSSSGGAVELGDSHLALLARLSELSSAVQDDVLPTPAVAQLRLWVVLQLATSDLQQQLLGHPLHRHALQLLASLAGHAGFATALEGGGSGSSSSRESGALLGQLLLDFCFRVLRR